MPWITQENMNITEERTKTKTHNIASLIPFSARHFKKSTSETKVDLKSDRLRILPLIAFQVKIISYRKVACTTTVCTSRLRSRIRFNRERLHLFECYGKLLLDQVVISD